LTPPSSSLSFQLHAPYFIHRHSCCALTAHSSLLAGAAAAAHCSLLTAHCSQAQLLLTAHCSSFIYRRSCCCSMLTAHCSQAQLLRTHLQLGVGRHNALHRHGDSPAIVQSNLHSTVCVVGGWGPRGVPHASGTCRQPAARRTAPSNVTGPLASVGTKRPVAQAQAPNTSSAAASQHLRLLPIQRLQLSRQPGRPCSRLLLLLLLLLHARRILARQSRCQHPDLRVGEWGVSLSCAGAPYMVAPLQEGQAPRVFAKTERQTVRAGMRNETLTHSPRMYARARVCSSLAGKAGACRPGAWLCCVHIHAPATSRRAHLCSRLSCPLGYSCSCLVHAAATQQWFMQQRPPCACARGRLAGYAKKPANAECACAPHAHVSSSSYSTPTLWPLLSTSCCVPDAAAAAAAAALGFEGLGRRLHIAPQSPLRLS